MSKQNSPVRVGVVGLGRAGWKIHLEALHQDKRFICAGAVDPDAERRAEAESTFGLKAFSSLDEMLKSCELELVVVATPSRFHYEDAKAVLNAGKSCILEKPMATSLAEANELVELAKAQKLPLLVHHQHTFNPMYNHLREVIDRGVLGPIFSVRTYWGGYSRRWDWQTLLKNGGGQLANTCPHTLSVLLPLLDSRVEEVFADLRNVKDPGDAEDHVELSLRTANGTTANMVVSAASALPLPQWMLLGRYGSLVSDGQTSQLRYYDPAKAPPLEVIDGAAPGRNYLRETLEWISEEVPSVPSASPGTFYDDVTAVLAGEKEPKVTPESALEVMRVSEMARAAARK